MYGKRAVDTQFLLLGALKSPWVRDEFKLINISPEEIETKTREFITIAPEEGIGNDLMIGPRGNKVLEVAGSLAKSEGAKEVDEKYLISALVKIDGISRIEQGMEP